MRTEIETITPTMARELLEANTDNRRLRENKVQQYARDMAAGKWPLTHQGIAIFDDNLVADGQHRLHACVRADTEFTTYVTRGLPRKTVLNGRPLEVRDAIDVGAGRKLGDQLQLNHGVANANFLAACARAICNFVVPSAPPLSVPIALIVISMFRRFLDEFRAVTMKNDKRLVVAYLSAPLAIYSAYDYERAVVFLTQMSSMKDMSNSARLFIQWFNKAISAKRDNRAVKMNQYIAMHMLANCITDADNNKTDRKVLRLSDEGRVYLLEQKPALARKIRNILSVPDEE